MNYPHAEILKHPHGAKASVVIVHDDGDKETCKYLDEIFTSEGLVGTVAMISKKVVDTESGELIPEECNFWQGLIDTGRFSIDSHSRTHTFWGLSDSGENGEYVKNDKTVVSYKTEPQHITREVLGSYEDLKRAFPSQRLLTFVKPGFGRHISGVQISDEAYSIIRKHYIAMRNTGGGVESVPPQDPYNLKSYMVRAEDEADKWCRIVDEAIETSGTLIFLFHAIRDKASGITAHKSESDKLFKYIGYFVNKGLLNNAFLDDIVLYAEEYRNAKITADYTQKRIIVKIDTGLDNAVYNRPLSVKIMLPDGCRHATSDGTMLAPDASNSILVDVVPGTPITIEMD